MKCVVLMLLMLICLKETKCQSFCGELELVDGEANCTGIELGSVCLFSCGGGFTMSGVNRSVCEVDGDLAIWNPPVPQCSDRDECLYTSEYNCSEGARCQNTYGSYQCVCENGFTRNRFDCLDVDECKNFNTCHEHANCSNSVGSYSCRCLDGFTGNGRNCDDIDECLERNICGDNSACVNINGSFLCICYRGFIKRNFTVFPPECIDINECNSPVWHDCDLKARCINTHGSYDCKCIPGYEGNGKTCSRIDQCLIAGLTNCHKNAECVDANNSYACVCKDGFEGNGTSCSDVDECKNEAHKCDRNAVCRNSDGNYSCSCLSGFIGDGFNCTEKNECSRRRWHRCSGRARCRNTVGSYQCTCKSGFNGNGRSCDDIDECLAGHSCSSNAKCVNTPGSYQCLCRDGFHGNGKRCDDLNECNDPSRTRCSANARCVNTYGNYTCVCNEGYQGDGVTCNDVNECRNASLRDCSEFADCLNTLGGFTCICRRGFGGDGKSCFDVDECQRDSTNNCHGNATCLNTLGSFRCSCKPGFGGNGTLCYKMDWCSMDTFASTCHPNATCTNVGVTFNCSCNEGYEGNGTFCTNINECESETDRCDQYAICTDTDGNYTCKCDSRFYGDGFRCIAKPRLSPRVIDVGESCISVVFDPSRSYGQYTIALEGEREPIVRNFSHPMGIICGLESGTTYQLSAAAAALRNWTEIKDPLFNDPIPVTTRYPPVYISLKMAGELFLPDYSNLHSPACQGLMSRYRAPLIQQMTRPPPESIFYYTFFRPRFLGFRRGSVIASVEAEVNTTEVTPELLDEIFRNSPNFSEPTLLNKPTTSVSIEVVNVTETSAAVICDVLKNSTSYEVQVMCDDHGSPRILSSDEARLIIGGLTPNRVCSVKARALIEVSNSAVAFTNFSDEIVFTTLPTIVNYTLDSTDTSITLSFNRINGMNSFNVTIAPSNGSYHHVVDEDLNTVKKTFVGLEHNTRYTVTLEMVSVDHNGEPLPSISETNIVKTKVSPSSGLWWIVLVVVGVILVAVAVVIYLKIKQLNNFKFKRSKSKSEQPDDVTYSVTNDAATIEKET